MSLQRQALFWIAVLAVLMALVWLLHGILLPFVAGMALAYLLDPLANRLERLGLNRAMATFAMVAAFVLALAFIAIAIVPVLARQLAELIANTPAYVERLQELVANPGWPWLSNLVGDNLSDFKASAYVNDAAGAFSVFAGSLWSGGRAVVSLLSLLIVTPVVAFYLLNDWPRIVKAVDSWLPRKDADTIRDLLRQVDAAIAGFVRGQTSICLILAFLYITGFTLIGLKYGFLIGLVTGLATFIPYVGSATGLIVGTTVAVVQFWPNWVPVIAVLAVCGVLQVLESYILSPFLVGPSVGLHPVWLMFALFTAGYLFGFVGLLVAIPVAAAIGVLVRFGMRRYMASSIYSGHGPA